MKSLLLVILFLILAIVVAGAIALGVTNLGVDRTAIESHTVYGTVKEIVVKPGRGDVEFVPASKLIRVRETQHYVIGKPALEQTRSGGVLTLETTCDDTRTSCRASRTCASPCRPASSVTVDGGRATSTCAASSARAPTSRPARATSSSASSAGPACCGRTPTRATSSSSRRAPRRRRADDSGDVDVDVAAKPRRVRRTQRFRRRRADAAARDLRDQDDVGLRRRERPRPVAQRRVSASSIDARTDSGDIALRPR